MPVTQGQGNPNWTRDETILALELVQRHWPKIPSPESDEAKALSALLRRLPLHADAKKNDTFRNPYGVGLKLHQLASLHPDKADRQGLRPSKTDQAVWSELGRYPDRTKTLADQITKGAAVLEAEAAETFDDAAFEAVEGIVLVRVHRIRERAPGFRSRVMQRVEKLHGVATCEACNCTAIRADSVGRAMFEVHHLIPLAQAATTLTRLPDLALLCANCHRLIHAAMKQDSRHYDLDQFREWLETQPLTSEREEG